MPKLNVYACGIPLASGKILLGLRAPHRRIYPSKWDVLGGKVEQGETVEQALSREFGEEIGVEPVAIEYLRPVTDNIPSSGGLLTYEMFLVTRWNGTVVNCSDEHTRIEWFALADAAKLPDLAVEDYRSLFREIELRTRGR